MRLVKIFVLFSIFLMSCHQQEKSNLTIATAANMQFTMEEITTVFFKETGITCEIITGSSGKLTAQIKQGAPFDIFVSADMKYPDELFASGFATKKPEIYAFGKLILLSMHDDIRPTMELLQDPKIKHIAIANPKTAPYGISAFEVLEKFNLQEVLKEKFVFGESISQTNQFIVSKVAEIGFTVKSVVMAENMREKGNWQEIDPSFYSPIAQGMVILKNRNTRKEEAEKFYDFLISEKGKEILNKFGYSAGEI